MVHKTWCVALLSGLISFGAVGCRAGHISDAALERAFVAHRSEYEQLLSMVMSDKQFITLSPRAIVGSGKIIDPRRASAADIEETGIAFRRWEQYQKLFSELGLVGGVNRGDGEVWFRVEDESMWNGAIIKGYVYSERPLPCVSDLDTYVPRNEDLDKRGDYVVYKHLFGSWYLLQASVG